MYPKSNSLSKFDMHLFFPKSRLSWPSIFNVSNNTGWIIEAIELF
jgi:hypothetical protein